MNRLGRAAVMVSIGAMAARLLWSGGYGWFVQQHMFIPLLLAAVVLIAFGAFEIAVGIREEQRIGATSRWRVAPTVGWLLLLPLAVLVAVAPTGLGAAAASRIEAFSPTEQTDEFPPLDTGGGPVEMRVYDFLDRAIWDDERSLDGVAVRLEGLVVNDDEIADGFQLTRFLVSCCAADGIPLQVALRGLDAPLEDNTWVIADVVWIEPDVPYADSGLRIVEAEILSIEPQPGVRKDPYESPY
ncbi:MAG: TIGR03943 family protein [Actinomycetota bacterium]